MINNCYGILFYLTKTIHFQFEFDKSVSVFSKFLVAPALLVAEVQHLKGKKFRGFIFT
jgi:hypothetical protein